MLDEYRRKGLGVTAESLLSELKHRGLEGAHILELGCGFGALTIELVKGGAISAQGIDLSPKMIETARSLASKAGVSGSTEFLRGDGAKIALVATDIVVLDAVLCCYPDDSALIDNTSSAARNWYAISLPDDRRPLTKLLKLFLPLQSIFLRRGSYRFYIHPIRKVIEILQGRGFTVSLDSAAGRIWSVLIFAAPSTSGEKPG